MSSCSNLDCLKCNPVAPKKKRSLLGRLYCWHHGHTMKEVDRPKDNDGMAYCIRSYCIVCNKEYIEYLPAMY